MEEKTLVVHSAGELEKVINKVKGVISSKVVIDDKEEISEIHVLAESWRSPKQVVRDIESALLVQSGININHKKISVVQTQDEEEKHDENRPRLVSINLLSSGLTAEAKVELSLGENVFEGNASGPNTAANRLRLVAAATLNCLENLLDAGIKFVVDDIVKIHIGRKEAINVTVSMLTQHGEDILLGSALIRNDDREAVGKAVLSAVNRKMTMF